MTWSSEPAAAGSTAISMEATTASDDSGSVQYNFDCVTSGCADSGWQSSPIYTDTGLVQNTEYGYQVIARDFSTNTTDPSVPAYATTDEAPAVLADPGIPSGVDNGSGGVFLNWGDNSANETGFELERQFLHKNGSWRGTTSLSTPANGGTQQEWTDDNSGSGTFRYRVRAVNASESSSWSDWSGNIPVTSGSGGGGGGEKPCRGNRCGSPPGEPPA
jgi:hypothetical protein